ncbi:indole-3-acetic acid-amido synthetase GH3.10 [Ipomoea triloba]|uniref:indole-3-acetic acid-amido synthetase GH3.10 n=1 Tax=Ipomoea triloba TaxID=35885 RepID=UPI00125D15AD|nr:indole-3-acetic acid-amido synthetase GH3.10 [Ipomoea triloba]
MGSQECDIIRWFDEVAENAGEVQRETLRRILEVNHGVEYLKKWVGDRDLNVEDGALLESLYTSLVPLSSHADLEPYVQRIADGDAAPLLTHHPITTLSLSSGTTEGRQKFLPFTRHCSQTTLQISKLAAAFRSRIYPTSEGKRILEFIYSGKQFETKGGVRAATVTTHIYASEEFKEKQREIKSFTCSPDEVIFSGDYKQSTYCHLLLGLHYGAEVEFVASTFAYSIIQAFLYFEEHWREICNDISDGTLSAKISLPKCRESVLKILTPNPDLAARIRRDCEELEREDWLGLIPKLWPNAKYIYSIMTGSMQPYLTKLRHYAGKLPLVSADYGATESWIGVNVDPSSPPEKVTFAVIPTFSYFEFIPLHRQKSQQSYNNNDNASHLPTDDFLEDDPVPLSQVKIGQEYEVVLTTLTGLYRYRLGDVVEVAGFYKNTPKLNFICRRKLILTVNIDKNTEKDLQLVVERGLQILSKTGAHLVDFTSHADVAKQPGHYVIYWEIKGEVEERVLGECCREMDASFVDQGYVVSRRTNSIGPLELRILERGTFRKILEHFIGNGAALSQFKTPRCITNQVLLRILNRCTIKRFHSTAYA